MKTSKQTKKVSKKWLAAGLAGASAVAAIAIALSSTLAATPVDVKLSNPHPSFPTVEIGENVPHAMRGALNATVSGALTLHGTVPPTAEMTSSGTGKLMLVSKKFTWEQDYQGVDETQPTGYYFPSGLVGYAPAHADRYTLDYSVYHTGSYVDSDLAADKDQIQWSSTSPLIDTVNTGGVVELLDDGTAVLTGTFTDKWGEEQTITFTLHVGDASAPITAFRLENQEYDISSMEARELITISGAGGNNIVSFQPTILQTEIGGNNYLLTGLKAGVTYYCIISSTSTSTMNAHIKNSNQIAGVDVLQMGKIIKKTNSSAFQMGDYVTTYVNPKGAPATSYQENAAAKSTILWHSNNEAIATCTSSGQVKTVSAGSTTITGVFEDKWGMKQEITFLLSVAIPQDGTQTEALYDKLQSAEQLQTVNKYGHTPSIISAMETAIANAKHLLAQGTSSDADLNSAKEALDLAILDWNQESAGTSTALSNARRQLQTHLRGLLYLQELNLSDYAFDVTALRCIQDRIAHAKDLLDESSTTAAQLNTESSLLRVVPQNWSYIAWKSFEALAEAETYLAQRELYTSASILALETAVSEVEGMFYHDLAAVGFVSFYTPHEDVFLASLRAAMSGLAPVGATPASFDFVIDTSISPSNADFGTSAKNIILQIGSDSGNDYEIDWGDGETNANTASHTYADAKEYTVKISGDLPGGIKFYNGSTSGDYRLKRVLTPLLKQKSTDLSDIFAICKNLASIPSGLFDNNIEATSFESVLYNCEKLASIPAGLFDQHIKATNFNGAFMYCYLITTIPSGLFDHNTAVIDFRGVFGACIGLESIPTDLLKNNRAVQMFEFMFAYCTGITGALPELWIDTATKFPALTNKAGCFTGCTAASNYAAAITAGWASS